MSETPMHELVEKGLADMKGTQANATTFAAALVAQAIERAAYIIADAIKGTVVEPTKIP